MRISLFTILIWLTTAVCRADSVKYQLEVFQETQAGGEMILLKSSSSSSLELLWTNTNQLNKSASSYIAGVFERKKRSLRDRFQRLSLSVATDAKEKRAPAFANFHVWKIYLNGTRLAFGSKSYEEAMQIVVSELNSADWQPVDAQKITRTNGKVNLSTILRGKTISSSALPIDPNCSSVEGGRLLCATKRAFFYFD